MYMNIDIVPEIRRLFKKLIKALKGVVSHIDTNIKSSTAIQESIL